MSRRIEEPISYESPKGRALVDHALRLHGSTSARLPKPIGHRVRRFRLGRMRRMVRCQLQRGLEFLADTADPIQCLLCRNGEWEGKIWDAVLHHVNPGDVAIDIGAHAGYALIRMGQAVGPTGRVHAFEPVPALRDQATRNARLNDMSARVTLHPQAVSDTNGTATLHYDPLESAGMSSLVPQRFLRKALSVPTVTLDAWLEAQELADVALVKIDVEGAESRVLRGMTAALDSGATRMLLVEVHLAVLAQQGDEGAVDALRPLRAGPYVLSWWRPEERFEAERDPSDLPEGGVAYLLAQREDPS